MANSKSSSRRSAQTPETPSSFDAALWRDYSKVYDEVLNVIPYRNLLLELVEQAEIGDEMRVFDACCGTGNLLWGLEQQNLKPHVVEFDYSEEMLEQARLKEYAGEVEFIRADIDQPVSEWSVKSTFDRFIFNNCLSFLADPSAVLAKTSSLANPGAMLIASTPRPNPNISELLDQHLELSQRLGVSREEALKKMMPKLQPIMTCNERLMQQYGDSYHLPNLTQLRGWFASSGWKVDSVSTTYAGQNWLVIASLDR